MSANLPPDEPPREPDDDTAETQQMRAGDPLGQSPEQPTAQQQQHGWAPPPPPQQPPGGPRGRLTRSRTDRMLAGVAGGLGRYFAIDPVIVRISIVVLTFFGGAGALLYLAAILLVPNEDEVPAGAAAPGVPGVPPGGGAAPPARNRALVVLGVVVALLVLGPIALAIGSLALPLAFLAVLGIAVAWLATGRRPDRDPWSLARATLLGLGLLVLLSVLSVGAFWAAGVGGETVIAIAVIAAGVAVLVGAFFRPMRWLVLPAVAVALPAAFVAAAGIDLDGGVGDRHYRPATVADIQRQYEIGAGQVTVDLRDVDLPPGDHRLDLDVGLGEAVVVVPEDVCVTTDASIGAGQADVFERGTGGVDVDWVDEATAKTGTARVVVDADIGIGHLDVRTTDPDRWSDAHDSDSPGDRDWGDWGDRRVDRGSTTGCAR